MTLFFFPDRHNGIERSEKELRMPLVSLKSDTRYRYQRERTTESTDERRAQRGQRQSQQQATEPEPAASIESVIE